MPWEHLARRSEPRRCSFAGTTDALLIPGEHLLGWIVCRRRPEQRMFARRRVRRSSDFTSKDQLLPHIPQRSSNLQTKLHSSGTALCCRLTHKPRSDRQCSIIPPAQLGFCGAATSSDIYQGIGYTYDGQPYTNGGSSRWRCANAMGNSVPPIRRCAVQPYAWER